MLLFFTVSSLYLWGNIYLANRLRWRWLKSSGIIKNTIPYIKKTDLKLTNDRFNGALAEPSIVNYKLKAKTLNKPSYRIIQLSSLLFLVFLCCLSLALLLLYYTDLIFENWQIESSLFGSITKILSNFKGIFPVDIISYLKAHIKEIVFITFLSGLLVFTKRLKIRLNYHYHYV